MPNGKVTKIKLKVGLIKNVLFYKMSYFPEPYTRSKNKIKVELDLYNYARKFSKMQQMLIHQNLLKRLI